MSGNDKQAAAPLAHGEHVEHLIAMTFGTVVEKCPTHGTVDQEEAVVLMSVQTPTFHLPWSNADLVDVNQRFLVDPPGRSIDFHNLAPLVFKRRLAPKQNTGDQGLGTFSLCSRGSLIFCDLNFGGHGKALLHD